MNIRDMVYRIKFRPCMYVGVLKLDYIYLFISGFLFNSISRADVEKIDQEYRDHFYEWVLKWMIDNYNVKDSKEFSITELIYNVCNNEEEAIELYFRLNELFFNNY